MNLQELKDEISNHPNVVLMEEIPDEDYGSYLFVRVTFIRNVVENDVDQMSVCIIVEDRDMPGETAYYKQKPFFLLGTSFADQVIAELAAQKVSNPNIEYYSFESIDETNKIVIVRVYLWDSENGWVEERRYAVFDDGGTLKFRLIKALV